MERIKVFDSRQNKILVVDKIRKTNAEWKNILTSDQYQVTTNKGTEQPFTCTLMKLKGQVYTSVSDAGQISSRTQSNFTPVRAGQATTNQFQI